MASTPAAPGPRDRERLLAGDALPAHPPRPSRLPRPFERLRHRWAALLADLRRNEGGPAIDRRTVWVLLSSPVLLTLFYYFGRTAYFRAEHMDWAAARFGAGWPYLELAPWVSWAGVAIATRIVLPLLLITLVLRDRPGDYGYRLRGLGRHLPVYGVLFVAMIPVLFLAATQASFQQKYPFYDGARLGGAHFWVFEACYFVHFVSLEAFFRGFLLFGLARRFGYYAVAIMAVPYCMIHFGKPLPETLAAILAGLILGTLALRSRSFVLGAALHYAVALTMDLLALRQAGAWPF